MATRRARVQFTIKRMKNFFNEFTQNKKAVVGVLIIAFYVALAILGPILTPYDPTRSKDWYLAGRLAAPEWFFDLGWGELSKNLALESYFSIGEEVSESKFTSTANKGCFIQYVSGVGNPASSGPGSISITYERQEQEPPTGKVYAYLSRQFHFPYDGAPQKILMKIALVTIGTTNEIGELDIPATIRIFLERIEENATIRYYMPTKTPKETHHSDLIGMSSLTNWQLYTSDSSTLSAELTWPTIEADMFSKKGEYIFGVEILFNDLTPASNERLKTTVFLDDLYMRLYGTAFGLLGTDYMGRDILTQFVHGARISLIVGLLSATLSVSIGLIFGLVSGYLGGLMDELMMRVNDMFLVLPGLPLLIVLMAVLGPSIWNIIILIGLLGWNGFARLVRSQTLSLKERPFIESAKAIGASKFYIIRRHILPNVMALVYVSLATSVPSAIVAEAALSWLGLFDPHRMSWGRILRDINVTPGAAVKWWWMLPPGLSIAALSTAFILIGYGLDEILNPKLRERR